MTMKSHYGEREDYKMPEAWAGIEARPLVTFEILNEVQPKNSALHLHWVNRVAGDGLRFNQMQAAGFVPAKPDEVWMITTKNPVPETMIKEGKVIYGDLIATLIGKDLYYAALKSNVLRAIELGDRLRLKDTVAPEVRRAVVGNAPNEIARKISTYVPTEKEVEAMSERNEKEGQNLG